MTTRILAAVALVLGLAALTPPTRADELADNAKAQAAAAGKAYENGWLRLQNGAPGAPDVDALFRWSRRWMEAGQETSDKKEDRLAAAQAHLERMKKLEDLVKKLHEEIAGADSAAAEFYRLEAERLVLLAKAAK